MQGGVDDREHGEPDVEVADGEGALVLDRERLAEDLERIDVEDAVRAARDVVAAYLVAVRRHGEEEEQEEERDDRQVVADEPARRQPDEEARDGADDHDQRDHDDRGQVDSELLGAEQRVGVRADAVERDVAEVEQAAPADDDVEAEREQHVEHGLERDALDVARAGEDGQQREGRAEEHEPAPPRHPQHALLDLAHPPGAPRAALAVARDPLVLADRGPGGLRGLGGRLGGLAHTFLIPACPSRPLGRKIMNAISSEKITRSDQRVVQ